MTWEGTSKTEKHSTIPWKYDILIPFKYLFSFVLKVRQARRGEEKKGCDMDFQVSDRLLNRLWFIHGMYFHCVSPTTSFVLCVLELTVPEASTALPPGLCRGLQLGGVSPPRQCCCKTAFLWPWSLLFALRGAVSEALAHIFVLCPVPVRIELEADSVTSTYTPV